MSLIQDLYDLELSQTELLYEKVCNGELISIRQYQSYRWMSLGGEMIQSLINLDKPNELLLPNLNTMLYAIELVDRSVNCLNIGAGTGSIDRYLKHTFPDLNLVSIEADQKIAALAEQYFQIKQQDIVIATAEDYLKNNQQKFDLILIDIYAGEQHPKCLYDEQFYVSLSKAMAGQCIVALNLLPETEEDLLKILKPLNDHVHCLLLHEVPEHDNVIIFALYDANCTLDKMLNCVGLLENKGIHTEVLSQNF